MTYNEIHKILSFEKIKLITTKLLCLEEKKFESSSLVMQSNIEPK